MIPSKRKKKKENSVITSLMVGTGDGTYLLLYSYE